jgi:hypothetical protein
MGNSGRRKVFGVGAESGRRKPPELEVGDLRRGKFLELEADESSGEKLLELEVGVLRRGKIFGIRKRCVRKFWG